jgi:hypothetical protein
MKEPIEASEFSVKLPRQRNFANSFFSGTRPIKVDAFHRNDASS